MLRPDILFPAYANGLNLAEAFYASIPYLSWQAIVVGDPLCAPFARVPLAPADINAGIVAETEMPRNFSTRYLDSFVQNGDPWLTVSAADRRERVTEISKPEARIPYAKAQSRRWRGDEEGDHAALREAIAIDPRFTAARLLIATQEEQAQHYDVAVEQYRAILDYDPNEPVSLNNLAYHLTAREGKPDEALAYAERACALRPNVPLFLDTLAWTQFLLGQQNEAARTISNALRSNPMDADLQWHAAAIFDAVHQIPQARVALKTALSLKPSLGQAADVAALRERLQMTED
jgi:Tfp pilus assembly protein PilF